MHPQVGPGKIESHTSRNLRGVLPFRTVGWRNLGLFLVSLLLFLLALEWMKGGARGLSGWIEGALDLSSPAAGLGFGWLASYLVLSGSPVAAVALTLFDVGTIDAGASFSMIAGSRLGGSLIVVLVGLIYALRGHSRRASILTGLLALIVTACVYLPAIPMGLLLLSGALPHLSWQLPVAVGAGLPLDDWLSALVGFTLAYLPPWAVFALGLAATVSSLNLIDRSLPQLHLEDNVFGGTSRLLYRPGISFFLGLMFTLLTMSVSVSLGLLIPLSVRGYVRRENLVPYIMGCNISTFIDTLIAAVLLRNPAAVEIVMAQILSVLVVSILILLLFYRRFEQLALGVAIWLNRRRGRLLAFFALIVVVPLLLVWL